MARDDLRTLRERAPEGLVIVRDIVSFVEAGLGHAGQPNRIARGAVSLGSEVVLAATIAPWNIKTGSHSSAYHRTVTARFPDHMVGGQAGPAIFYDILLQNPNAELPPTRRTVKLPGEPLSTSEDVIDCTHVEIAGMTKEGPMLFSESELDMLDPEIILRRLEIFKTLASIAIK